MRQLYVVILLVLLTVTVAVQPVLSERTTLPKNSKLYVDVYPAPVGYSYTFTPPYPDVIYGFHQGRSFVSYVADIKSTGTLLLIDNYPSAFDVVSSIGTSKLNIIEGEDFMRGLGLVFDGARKGMIIYGGGELFTSPFKIYWRTQVPEDTNETNVVIVDVGHVDFNEKGIKVLFVPDTSDPITVRFKDSSIDTTLTDLVGLSSSCITKFKTNRPDFPWTGGIVVSPSCTSRISIIKKDEFAGRLYVTIFGVHTKYGKIDYVVLAKPSTEILLLLGLLSEVQVNGAEHIVKDIDLTDTHLYLAPSMEDEPVEQPVLRVINSTEVLNDNKYICTIPDGSKLIYTLLWKSRPLNGTVNLLPGEVILFSYHNNTYFCSGDLGWLDNNEFPHVSAPKYKELKHDIYFYTENGKEFLVVLSNGEIYSGKEVKLPFSKYDHNMVFVVSGGIVDLYRVQLVSMFKTTTFLVGVMIFLVLGGMIVFGRGTEASEKIKVVIDIPYPKALSTASKDELASIAKKHVDMFGVCPSDIDLAYYHGVLPPISDDVKPDETVLICPFKTNKNTEIILREINKVLLHSFWALKRVGRSHGYVYTVLGEEMPYMYFYKQENEKKPEEILVNAIIKASRVRIQTAYFLRSLGLFIVAEPHMAKKLREELKILESETEEKPSTANVESYSYNISGYISIRGVKVKVHVDKLQKFVNEKIHNIIIVSSDNITELIEYLASKYLALAEIYYGKLRRI